MSMKLLEPRQAIDVIAEVLSINVPIDALEAAQTRGEVALPNYRLMARMVWVKLVQEIAEPLSVQKELYKQRKPGVQSLLQDLVVLTMKSMKMPENAAGIAAILALMLAKIEFHAFSDQDEDEG